MTKQRAEPLLTADQVMVDDPTALAVWARLTLTALRKAIHRRHPGISPAGELAAAHMVVRRLHAAFEQALPAPGEDTDG